jgi:hypothetical protein
MNTKRSTLGFSSPICSEIVRQQPAKEKYFFYLTFLTTLEQVLVTWFFRATSVTHFWVPAQKMKKYKKKYISRKIYSEGIKKFNNNNNNNNNNAGMPIKWLEIGLGGLKIQELKFDSIFLTGESLDYKENSILRKKSPKSDIYGFN